MNARTWLVIGALMGAAGVGIGAFGAHGLQSVLAEELSSTDATIKAQAEKRLKIFETGVRYQMYHAVALVLVGLLARQSRRAGLNVAGWSFLIGIIVFSGLLYLLVLTGMTILGAIVPIGGIAFIVGWCALAWFAWQREA